MNFLRQLLDEITGNNQPAAKPMARKAQRRPDVRYEDGSGVQDGAAYGAGDSAGDIPRTRRYEDGSITRGQVSVSPGYNTQQVNQPRQRQQRPLSVGNAQGNPMAGQRTISPGLGSGTRMPDFTQPSRQMMYEDEFSPTQSFQDPGFTNQTGLNGGLMQGSLADYLRRIR